jgi:glycolate oxidase iron-sulfur subunit
MIPVNKPTEFPGIILPNSEFLNNCIHCGLCLPTCPTYAITGLERSSPRGRIRMIKAVAEGTLPISEDFIYEMNFCLDCQACETACPAGIRYGSLVESARVILNKKEFKKGGALFFHRFMLGWMFGRFSRLKILARILWIIQQSGLLKLINRLSLMSVLPKRLSELISLAPRVTFHYSSDTLSEHVITTPPTRYKILFLTGCIMDVAFSSINEDAVELLKFHGCDVIIPKGQCCCGSLQAHNGDMATARELAWKIIELFSSYDFDYIVLDSAGCGAFMKEYSNLFDPTDEKYQKAVSISHRVKDITEFLVETDFKSIERNNSTLFRHKIVTYHDACHLIHTQKISLQPRKLIQDVPGIEYRELPEASWCCGSAGIYNILHFEDSMKILDRKIVNIRKINPDLIVMGNPGCMLQLDYGLKKAHMHTEVMHITTFLRKAYGI